MRVIDAQNVSKQFLLRHNASVELKVRFLGLQDRIILTNLSVALGGERSVNIFDEALLLLFYGKEVRREKE